MFTNDVDRAYQVARRLRSGTVGQNGFRTDFNIAFGGFKNQIEYQNAGAGINRAMKAAVLDKIDAANLTGKTVEVTGAFRLITPKNWLITPVEVVVK